MNEEIILTPEGKTKLEQELQELKQVKIPDIIKKIEEAKEMGDLSENAEYHDAKDQQGMYAARVVEIETILKKAIMQENATDKESIQIGSNFVVEKNGVQKELTIVGFNEADPVNGKISNDSPMGQAFIGKKPGNIVQVEAPIGLLEYKIIEIK